MVKIGDLFFGVPVLAISESQTERLVEKAPEAKSEKDSAKLVKSLTHKLKNDRDKAYTILNWITKNIDYNEFKKRQLEEKLSRKNSKVKIPESGDIYKTRLGVCEDIASLYKNMLEKAEIKAVVIHGCTGEVDKKKGGCKDGSLGHAWNAVWIDKQWEFVDPTWAISGEDVSAMDDVTKQRKYEKELKKREKKSAQIYEARSGRSVDKKWFMTDPKVMEQTHQPNDKKWLLKKSKDRRNKDL